MNFLKKILMIFILLFIITSCDTNKSKDFEQVKNVELGIIGNDEPIKRDLVSKMLALANYDKQEIETFERVILFKDTTPENWHDKYINATYLNGDLNGVSETKFDTNGFLTLEQAQYLIDKYDKTGKMKIKIDKNNKDKPVSYALWCDIYQKIMPSEKIEIKDFVIIETFETLDTLKKDYAITDKGLFCFEGFEVGAYVNKKIEVITNQNDVLAIIKVLEDEPTLNGVFIEKVHNKKLDIFVGGIKKTILLGENHIDLSLEGNIADIKIKDDRILDIKIYKQYIEGSINMISDSIIRINNKNYVMDDDFKVYSNIDGKVVFSSIKDLIIGQDIARFFIKENENKVYAAIINKKPDINKVRVLINDNNSESDFLSEIKITSKNGLKVYVKGKEKIFDKDYILHIKKGQDFGIGEKEIIRIEPINYEDGLNFVGLKKQNALDYFGVIEICKIKNEYIVINEVLFDQYIMGVVSSFDIKSDEMEFLKTLAILARNNAINQVMENNYYKYGANVLDSSKSQIYNNINISEKVKNAVNETKDLVVKNNGNIVFLNYFGYSGGTTSNMGDIWPNKKNKEYPTNSPNYLTYKIMAKNLMFDNISSEIDANIFFKSKDIDFIENDSEWFRWTTSLENTLFSKYLNSNIEMILKKYPNFVKIVDTNGNYINKKVDDIGEVLDIYVVQRGLSGNVMQVKIVCEKYSIIIYTDNVIKNIFNVNYVIKNNGKRISINSLPSSYFVFDKIFDENQKLKKINFYGGGYGHGVGLSLYGANKMAQNGSSFYEILNYFYSNISIEKI